MAALSVGLSGCSPALSTLRVVGEPGRVEFEWVQCRSEGIQKLSVYVTTELEHNGDSATPVWRISAPGGAVPLLRIRYGVVPDGWSQKITPAPLLPAEEYTAMANEGSTGYLLDGVNFRTSQLHKGVVITNEAGKAKVEPMTKADRRPKTDYGCYPQSP